MYMLQTWSEHSFQDLASVTHGHGTVREKGLDTCYMLPICIRTGGSNECCFGIRLVHGNGCTPGMTRQAHQCHTRGYWQMLAQYPPLLVELNGVFVTFCSTCGCLTLLAPQRELPSDMPQAKSKSTKCLDAVDATTLTPLLQQSHVRVRKCRSCSHAFGKSRTHSLPNHADHIPPLARWLIHSGQVRPGQVRSGQLARPDGSPDGTH